ncbi:MAG: hypothetical protein IKW81_12435 [Pseudobutyrivibrio sp.]|nr:hypothetical protein [Pseudobutyrivibrio sp.]
MAKEYLINNTTYTFSKEKFQDAVQDYIKQKRANGEKYVTSSLYFDMAEALNVSAETIRKWYGKGNTSPADIGLLHSIAQFLNIKDATSLLDLSKEEPKMEKEIEINPDRDVVKRVFQELIDFVDWMVNDISVTVKENGAKYIDEHRDVRFNKLLDIHTIVDKFALDIKPSTSKKLHNIILAYTENVTTPDVSSYWDRNTSEEYYGARWLLGMVTNNDVSKYNTGDSEAEEWENYINKIFPWEYEDDEDYYYIPFTYQFAYKREFANTLINIFRNEFPEYFAFDGEE